VRRVVCAVAVAAAGLATAPAASARIAAIRGFFPGAGRVVVAHDDGSHQRRLGSGDEAWISPNGKLVATVDTDPGQQGTHARLKIYRAAGGAPRVVIHARFHTLTWSPDSRMLAGPVGGLQQRLQVIDAETGARTTLAGGDLSDATFSPDSKQVAYTRYTGQPPGGALDVVDLATHAVRTLHFHASLPVWGSQQIAFSALSGHDDVVSNIAAINPDGSGFRQLTHSHSGSALYPIDWSSDGTRLLAADYAQTTPLSLAVDPVTGDTRVIARHVDPDALSTDGRVVIGHTGNPFCCSADPINVVRVPWAGGKPHILIRKAFDASSNR
jgi:Tol biopolymer transport system component